MTAQPHSKPSTTDHALTPEERLQRVAHFDHLLEQASQAVTRLESVSEELEGCWKDMSAVLDYYESNWMADFEALEKDPRAAYWILSEDGAWNEFGRFYEMIQEVTETTQKILKAYRRD